MATANYSGTLRIWRPADLQSLELRLGTSFQHTYPRHWHEEFFISAITAGAGRFHYRGSYHLATPGTLTLVTPGEVHAHCGCDGGRSFRSIHMPWSLVADIAAEVTQRADSLPAFPSSVIADARILRGFLKLHRLLEGTGTGLHPESLLLSFVAELLRCVSKGGLLTSAPGRECLAVRRAREFMDGHYNQAVSLKDLAALANLSPYYFHRVFCRQIGMPPHAYQIQLRIMRAKTLIKEHRPIAYVASITGFADQSHFTRHFKRLMGVTPAQYADQGKNVQDIFPQSR